MDKDAITWAQVCIIGLVAFAWLAFRKFDERIIKLENAAKTETASS